MFLFRKVRLVPLLVVVALQGIIALLIMCIFMRKHRLLILAVILFAGLPYIPFTQIGPTGSRLQGFRDQLTQTGNLEALRLLAKSIHERPFNPGSQSKKLLPQDYEWLRLRDDVFFSSYNASDLSSIYESDGRVYFVWGADYAGHWGFFVVLDPKGGAPMIASKQLLKVADDIYCFDRK